MNVLNTLLLIVLLTPAFVRAETAVTPFFSVGAYHRDCSITDRILCDNYEIGSDTPGTIDLGLRFRGCGKWCGYADAMDVGLFHQSYVDRGQTTAIGGVGPESYMNMYGIRLHWEIESWQFVLPF